MVTVNEDTMSTIQLNGSTITLLGTAHVSKESVELVEEKILSKGFDCVAVELCPARYENLKNSPLHYQEKNPRTHRKAGLQEFYYGQELM